MDNYKEPEERKEEIRNKERVTIWELCKFFRWLIEHRKEVEEFMAQVQFAVSIAVNSTTSALQVTPTSGSASFTVGVAGDSGPIGAVSGGTPPYSVSVDAASPNPLPPGLNASLDSGNNLHVSGTPTAAGSGSVLLDIDDSAGASVSVAARLAASEAAARR
jgi:hypothetical protein